MPETIFKKGLYEHGGHYQISPEFRNKIYTPGFIPSGYKVDERRKKEIRKYLGIKKDEKLVFSYFGIREGAYFGREDRTKISLKKYLYSLEKIAPLFDLKIFIKLTNPQQLPQYEWLITADWLSREEMIEYPASSDLVIQHHGLGELPKVIRNQVSVLCITPDLEGDYPYYRHSAYFEIDPFEKLGLCQSINDSFSTEILQENIEKLLFDNRIINQMKNAQEQYFEAGEKNAYDKLMQELRKRG